MITESKRKQLTEELLAGNTDTLTNLVVDSFVDLSNEDWTDTDKASKFLAYANLLLNLAVKNKMDKEKCDCQACRASRGEESGFLETGIIDADLIDKIKAVKSVAKSKNVNVSPPLWKIGPFYATNNTADDGSVSGKVIGIEDEVAYSGPDEQTARENLEINLRRWLNEIESSGRELKIPTHLDVLNVLRDQLQSV